MLNKIAVIVDNTRTLSSFEAGTNINIYCKQESTWKLEEEITYSLNHSFTIPDIRDYIRTVILNLKDCKIIIGKTIAGLPYHIFNRMGFEIYESNFISDSILDEISSEVAESTSMRISSQPMLSILPVQTEVDGIYYLNLIDLQDKHPEISSKKALQEFLSTKPFHMLELICSHVPPWFEHALPARKLTYRIEDMQKGKLKVTIYKECCNY